MTDMSDRDGDEGGIDIRSIFGVLRRHLRLIIVTVVVVVGVSAVVVLSLKPAYTASALVLVDTSRKNLLSADDPITGSSSDSARVDSEVELAKSETVLLKVVDALKLFNEPEYQYQPGLVAQALNALRLRPLPQPSGQDLLDGALSQLRNAVSVQRRGLTFLIAVQARSSDPALAAKLANAVAETYISEQLQAKIDSTLASRDLLQGRLKDASAAVSTSEDAVDAFISTNIAAIADETGRSDLTLLSGDISNQDQLRQQLATLLKSASDNLQSKDYAALTQTLQTEALAGLEARRKQIESTLQSAETGSQVQIDLQAELAKIDAQLDTAARTEIDNLQQKVSQAQSDLAGLRQKLRTDVLSSQLSSTTLTRIYELQQTAEIARTQYQTLLTRLKDLDQQAYVQVADSRIASQALPPDAPSFPNTRLLLLLSGVAALGLGVALAFLYENVFGGIVSEEQLRNLTHARQTLTVPKQRELKGSKGPADAVAMAPLSVFSESIRRLRVSLDQSIFRARRGQEDSTRRGRVVLVSSSAPYEGKTTTALSLARAYALAGSTVLLIDCDLRKPSLHRLLGREPRKGLIDYLAGGDEGPELAEIVGFDDLSGAGIVLGSRRSNTPTDQFVAGSAFAKLIDAATNSFDVVVLDTPPVGPVVDGVYLAQFADAVLFAVKWASTSQSDVRSSLRVLGEAVRPGVEIIPVLTQSARPTAAYYGRYTGYYLEEPTKG